VTPLSCGTTTFMGHVASRGMVLWIKGHVVVRLQDGILGGAKDDDEPPAKVVPSMTPAQQTYATITSWSTFGVFAPCVGWGGWWMAIVVEGLGPLWFPCFGPASLTLNHAHVPLCHAHHDLVALLGQSCN
jgi:hypothetical protein